MSLLQYSDLLSGDPSNEKIKDVVDRVFSNTSTGSISSAITDTIIGLNHRQQPNSVQINRDYYGLTFFTRPRMNMSSDNLRQVREFSPLLTTVDKSLPRAIRAILDTECRNTELHKFDHGCSLVDDNQSFIPILTNQLISMSGWPDIDVPTYTSKPGAYKEEYGHVDGITRIYSSYDITANFRNLSGDPIIPLFLTWVHYASLAFTGILVPYYDSLIENEIDSVTRIYRLVLDPSKKYVQKIAACGYGFPVNCPIGNVFNFESGEPLNRANDQITIRFRCFGAIYNDPILIDEFNKTVQITNSDMSDGFREKTHVKLNADTAVLFNHQGYPRIHPDTWELEWWVRKEKYQQLLGSSTSAESDDSDYFVIKD